MRRLERTCARDRDPAALGGLLRRRLRAGAPATPELLAAARLGHRPAREALGDEAPPAAGELEVGVVAADAGDVFVAHLLRACLRSTNPLRNTRFRRAIQSARARLEEVISGRPREALDSSWQGEPTYNLPPQGKDPGPKVARVIELWTRPRLGNDFAESRRAVPHAVAWTIASLAFHRERAETALPEEVTLEGLAREARAALASAWCVGGAEDPRRAAVRWLERRALPQGAPRGCEASHVAAVLEHRRERAQRIERQALRCRCLEPHDPSWGVLLELVQVAGQDEVLTPAALAAAVDLRDRPQARASTALRALVDDELDQLLARQAT